jgi:hypothetical protein
VGHKQTPTAKVGDIEGCQGLEGTPFPLHRARVKEKLYTEGQC